VCSLVPPPQLLHLAHSGQAFVEFPSHEAAVAAEAHYARAPLSLRGREPKISVSTQNSTIQRGNNIIALGPNGFVRPTAELDSAGPATRVVILNIFNSQQTPVTLEAIHSLCTFVGLVNRIVLFEKEGRVNAMVEFADIDVAIKAQKVLFRHHLWNNQTGLILTAFGKHNEVSLPGGANSARAHDYTGSNLKPVAFAAPAVQGNNNNIGYDQVMMQQQQQQQGQLAPHQMMAMFQQQQEMQMQAYRQQQQHNPQQQPQYVYAAPPAPQGQEMAGGSSARQQQQGLVVMVSGPPKTEANVMCIYNLMSFWGNVRMLKFLGKKENVAAVEYFSAEEATNAINLCKGASIDGVPIQVTNSRFQSVQVSGKEAFARDFSQDRTKRYPQGPQSQHYVSVMCVPSQKLHVANLQGYSEAAVRDLFATIGGVVAMNFMQDNPQVGFVTMASVGEACNAVCKLHGRANPFDATQRALKVSFARK
jgi:hnRNP-L/PTB/hephaestus splicing factor